SPAARAVRAAATSSRPQPVNGSRPRAQSEQPSEAFASTAERSSSHETWSGVSVGSTPRSSAAAAETWGAANEVPTAFRYSNGPQSEYACPAHDGREASTRLRGTVERMATPGAAMSTYCASRFEKGGTPPSRPTALTPITCGSAAG